MIAMARATAGINVGRIYAGFVEAQRDSEASQDLRAGKLTELLLAELEIFKMHKLIILDCYGRDITISEHRHAGFRIYRQEEPSSDGQIAAISFPYIGGSFYIDTAGGGKYFDNEHDCAKWIGTIVYRAVTTGEPPTAVEEK